jgi:2-keto-3-deoxy-L-rhamnonate aldolase RhmA
VRSPADPDISMLLDNGVTGIIAPDVNTADDAKRAVDGVDLIHIGCNDYLVDIGKPGQFGCPEMMDAVAAVIAAAKRHGKFAGLGGDRDLERQTKFIRGGVRFVTTQTDIAYLMAEASRKTAALRTALDGSPGGAPRSGA